MKKVLVWGVTPNMGGLEMVVKNYISNMNSNKIQFDLISAFADNALKEFAQLRGGKVFSLPSRRQDYYLYKKELMKFAEESLADYDAVWLNDCSFANIDIINLAKKYGVPKRIVHAHNSQNMAGGISRLIRHKINVNHLSKTATNFWACSELAGQWSYSNKILHSPTYKIIPNAINLKRFCYDESVRNKTRIQMDLNHMHVFIHVGRFHYQKNHKFLIDVFDEIKKKQPNSVLLLVGDGEDLHAIKNKVDDLGLSQSVRFLGTRSDIEKLLQAADAFIMPSFFEGLPVVLVEAQGTGLPCYCSDTITEEVCLLPSTQRIELSKSPEFWAKTILKDLQVRVRNSDHILMTSKGYNIVDASKKMEAFFLNEDSQL